MKKHEIVMIGAGNVSYHLARQFKKAGHHIRQIYSRTLDEAKFLAEEVQASATDDPEVIDQGGSLYVIAVNDDAVEEVAEQFYLPKAIVVHTSAMITKEVLEPMSDNIGVFYPLQTMTKGYDLDFREIPIFIEASDEEVKDELFKLAEKISEKVFEADLKKRMTLHAAAVFVNNFTNHLFHAAESLLKKDQLPLEVLKPLIMETIRKVEQNAPVDVQTGPARRGDMHTVEKHLEFLRDDDDFREIYLVLTESIINTYRK